MSENGKIEPIWGISEYQSLKFSSTMVKDNECQKAIKLSELSEFGTFQKVKFQHCLLSLFEVCRGKKTFGRFF